jgi:GxxExxY protein
MNIIPGALKCCETTDKILHAYYGVYNELGPGFLESVYEQAMTIAMCELGLEVRTQVPVPVWFRNHRIGDFRADMLVNGVVLVELKTAKTLDRVHEAQLTHYLKATEIEVGLLLNFGPHAQFRRIVFENVRKKIRENPRESAVEAVGAGS